MAKNLQFIVAVAIASLLLLGLLGWSIYIAGYYQSKVDGLEKRIELLEKTVEGERRIRTAVELTEGKGKDKNANHK